MLTFASFRRLVHLLLTTTIAIGLALGGSFALSAHPVQAAATTITVNSLSDDQTVVTGACLQSGTFCLRNAIGLANAATTPTTINFSVTGIIYIGTTLTIDNATQPITIDGSGQTVAIDGGKHICVMSIVLSSVVTLNSLTIQNGIGYVPIVSGLAFAGGIYSHGTLTLTNSIVSGNSGDVGGGLFSDGTATIQNSTFMGNSSGGQWGYGGGLVNAGSITIDNSVFSYNSAASGEAISNDGGAMIINNTTISHNINGTLTSYEGYPVAVETEYTTPFNAYPGKLMIIRNSTISENDGDGVYGFYALLLISNSTISNNSGNGIILDSGTLTLANTTIANNTGTGFDGSGYANLTISTMLSSIIAHNMQGDIRASVISLGHNLVADGTYSSGLINGVNGDQVGTAASPINPKLAPLNANGGLTKTMALYSGSPALGAGDCSGSASNVPISPPVTTDQHGVLRGNPCDIGAYEGVVAAPIDSIGVYRGNTFYLRLHNSTGAADIIAPFTAGSRPYPIVGDWTGTGFDTIGVYDQASGTFYLRNSNVSGYADAQFTFGNPDDRPLSGRWSIDASHAGTGVYRSSNGILYLKNELTTGYSDAAEVLGNPGDYGVAGDWTGKGFDSPGIYRPAESKFYLSNVVGNGIVYSDILAIYGNPGDMPVIGDWMAQGHDGLGLFRPGASAMLLRNSVSSGASDTAFVYGNPSDVPLAGHWQAVYPPVVPMAPASVLIPKTAIPTPGSISAPGGNQIGG